MRDLEEENVENYSLKKNFKIKCQLEMNKSGRPKMFWSESERLR